MLKRLFRGALFVGVSVVLLIIALLAIICVTGVILLINENTVYETNNVADYGNITGNYDNNTPRKYVFSFFPEKIEEYFSQPQYHYKAIKGDTYAYEICLEFVIEDEAVFKKHIKTATEGLIATPFVYDKSFIDYTISNNFHGSSTPKESEVVNAGIGKILVNENEHRIIYIAVGTYDGGFATKEDLDYYWTRWNTD